MNDTSIEYITAPDTTQSISFNLANTIRDIISDPTLSQGASRVLVQLVLSSGRKGWTWYLIETLGVLVKSSRTQVKVYLRELVEKDRIKIVHRPGRSSVYQIVGIYNKSTEVGRSAGYIKQSYKYKTNVKSEKPNVISICPEKLESLEDNPSYDDKLSSGDKQSPNNPQPPLPKPVIRMDIVRALVQATNDHHSFGFWCKVSRDVDIETIQYCLSALKVSINDGTVSHSGRYLTSLFKTYAPEIFSTQKQPLRASQQKNDAPIYSKPCESEPEIDVDWKMNIRQLKHIQKMLGK